MKHLSLTKIRQLFLVHVIALAAISCNPIEPDVKLSITPCAPMPTARAAATCFVIANKAYIWGGRDSVGTYCNDMWQYDSSTDSWKHLGVTPLTGRVNATACVYDGRAYIGLGFNGTYNNVKSYLTDWWCYDPVQNTWEQLENYPASTSDRAVSLVGDGELYVGYGFNWTYERDMYRYRIADDTWEYIDVHLDRNAFTFPIRSFGGVGSTCQNRHFVGTGFRGHSLNWWGEWLPEGKWLKRKNVPGAKRTLATCTASDDYVYVIGGMHYGGVNTDGQILSDILQYNPQDDSWMKVGEIPSGGLFNHISFCVHDDIYIGLGENENLQLTNQLYCVHEK